MIDNQSNKSLLLFYVFIFFLLINLISNGAHTDMWDGMVTFLVTESMAIKHTAMLHPDIPTISKSDPGDQVGTMMLHETKLYKYVTGKYSEWIKQQQNQQKE